MTKTKVWFKWGFGILLLSIIFIGLGAKCPPWKKDKHKDIVTGSSSPPVPLAPSNLTMGTSSDGMYTISWTDNSDNEDYFEVEEQILGSDIWTLVRTVDANVTSSAHGPKSPNTYYYRVRACNSHGCSGYSNVVCRTVN